MSIANVNALIAAVFDKPVAGNGQMEALVRAIAAQLGVAGSFSAVALTGLAAPGNLNLSTLPGGILLSGDTPVAVGARVVLAFDNTLGNWMDFGSTAESFAAVTTQSGADVVLAQRAAAGNLGASLLVFVLVNPPT